VIDDENKGDKAIEPDWSDIENSDKLVFEE
jgi:hypothetical protein